MPTDSPCGVAPAPERSRQPARWKTSAHLGEPKRCTHDIDQEGSISSCPRHADHVPHIHTADHQVGMT